jgi:hypothetical protein
VISAADHRSSWLRQMGVDAIPSCAQGSPSTTTESDLEEASFQTRHRPAAICCGQRLLQCPVPLAPPDQVNLPGRKDSDGSRSRRHRDPIWQWIKEAAGWARLTGQCKGEVDPGLEAWLRFAYAQACRASLRAGDMGEWDEFWHSAEQAAAAHRCCDVPLVIVSQDRPKPRWSAQAIADQPLWYSLQESLRQLSPNSRRVVARNRGHHVVGPQRVHVHRQKP